ncbi:Glutamyl-tRNA(Gln) amidotransferase subunit A [Rhynchospora pubera]|uniref:Glutamyl-tRNA(Gln) amidotransferase subunit A n=1 Tax=Rhynchospora pubera TaxID=906938 RepID=A0AAV8F936_9POAL|nr:Glutamyl-tRNA(Gln) amidotransferase subunit A [Rhynchospora pubera]KAJ4807121.1 Glutamyl-tRNA(Gln) amidotransferase subunit A [Rhynchospora pubera]
MSKPNSPFLHLFLSLFLATAINGFQFEEATVESIQTAFNQGILTSRLLTEYYLSQIETLNPLLHAVIEVNPDALSQADQADQTDPSRRTSVLHGIPVLLKDNIATKDKLNTTSGSLALGGSVAPRDAGVVQRLRDAGAVILGKASMSEWCNFRAKGIPAGWSARGGQGKNPYVLSATPCSSSSGSAIAVAANMVTVTLGTETDGSIICPSSFNSVVGIKPTVGLTSRSGVMIISPRMDTIGPICRTVSDAVHVLEAIVGNDPLDAEATTDASVYIPEGGYKQFLKNEGLRGKRLGILRKGFFSFPKGSLKEQVFEEHFKIMREGGAVLVDDLEIANISIIRNSNHSGEWALMQAEFKLFLNAYLSDLSVSPVRSLQDVIEFNNNHPIEEKLDEFSQTNLIESQQTDGYGYKENQAISNLNQLCEEGLEKLMKEQKLDAIVTPGASASSILAIGGYPGISVPAGYDSDGIPFGICFGGLKGFEPRLIEIAFAFEQATRVRKQPNFGIKLFEDDLVSGI